MKTCSYCNIGYELSRDHVIPQSYLRYGRRRFRGDWLVPACKECNSTLSDELIFNVPDRAKYLLIKYLKKYKKELAFEAWGDDDLEDVSDNLKDMIQASLLVREEIEERLNYLSLVSEMPDAYLEKEGDR